MESGFKAISHVVFDLNPISPVELDFNALQGSIFGVLCGQGMNLGQAKPICTILGQSGSI